MNKITKYFLYLLVYSLPFVAYGQDIAGGTDSWEEAKRKGSGTITILWCEIEPFIYHRGGAMTGVEYELMEGFAAYLEEQYHIKLNIHWKQEADFSKIYPRIQSSREKGLFAVSYYSITANRKEEVSFSPPYMPDLNIIVSSNELPVFESEIGLISNLKTMKGYTMAHTTMEEDLLQFRKIIPSFTVEFLADDYKVMERIAEENNAIGYIPLSIYVVGLQRGIKVKRQKVLASKREGFAAIYTKNSDWKPAIDAYFSSAFCRNLTKQLIHKHLGEEVAGIILEVSEPDSTKNINSDLELLTKEREIVTGRYVRSALDAQKQKTQKNITIVAIIILLAISAILYSKFKAKKKYLSLLQQRNKMIVEQKQEIEQSNLKLQQKLAISQLNPHLVFNALTAVQHYMLIDDKKSANKYMSQLSKFIRLLLSSSGEPVTDIHKEKAMLEQYLSLEQARFGFKFDFELHINNGTGAHRIPSMLIFPFVEDVLYCRILKYEHPGEKPALMIGFNHISDHVSVTIKDNTGADGGSRQGPIANSSVHIARQQIEVLNNSNESKITIKEKEAESGVYRELIINIPDDLTI